MAELECSGDDWWQRWWNTVGGTSGTWSVATLEHRRWRGDVTRQRVAVLGIYIKELHIPEFGEINYKFDFSQKKIQFWAANQEPASKGKVHR